VRADEATGIGERRVTFVEHRREALEHMGHAGRDLERHGDVQPPRRVPRA
jgi:hypothetical protein